MNFNSSFCESVREADGREKFREICPKPDDECHSMIMMQGASISYCEVSGWSPYFCCGFPNLSPNLVLREAFNSKEENPTAKSLREGDSRITLRELQKMIKQNNKPPFPFYVQVVGKKKWDLIQGQGNKCCIISILIIADESGYCALSVFNEGLKTIFEAVEVGDFLLITRAEIKNPWKPYHHGLFSNDMYLDMEVKLQANTTHNHYIYRFDVKKFSKFVINPALLGPRYDLKMPSELDAFLSGPSPKFFDVAGIINYVGRIQRFRMGEPIFVLDDNNMRRDLPRFITYRWISIIDKTSKAIPIKIYIHNTVEASQSSIVPGALVIMTNCQVYHDPNTSGKYITNSDLSLINVEQSAIKYLALLPTNFREKAKVINNRENYFAILSRKDVNWAVGGTISMKIQSAENMLRSTSLRSVPIASSPYPLLRRESRYQYFKGVIYRVTKYFTADWPAVTYIHEDFEAKLGQKTKEKSLDCFPLYFIFKNLYWYTFVRRLPPLDPKIFEGERTAAIRAKVIEANRIFCGPLLTPAQMDENTLDPDGYPPLAKLEMVDGPPLLYLDIYDEITQKLFTVMWKPSEYSYTIQEMEEKVLQARGKTIMCFAEIFCIEAGFPAEVLLRDFVLPES